MDEQVKFPATVSSMADCETYAILGQAVRVLARSSDAESGNFCFAQITPPGLGVPPHCHTREDEVVFVLEGELQFQLGGQTMTVKAGDTVNLARGTTHGFMNMSAKPARTIWVVSPGAAFEAFFDEVKAFPAGPPDFDRLDALHVRLGVHMPRPA